MSNDPTLLKTFEVHVLTIITVRALNEENARTMVMDELEPHDFVRDNLGKGSSIDSFDAITTLKLEDGGEYPN